MTERDSIIDAIVEIELHMFLTVNPVLTSECQQHPESFELHRRAQFAPWTTDTLESYLEDLREAQERGDNLLRQKYARMEGIVPPAQDRPVLEEILRLMVDWQRDMFRDYPALMSAARPLTDEETHWQMTSFETYTRGELETYSERTLQLLHRDLLAMQTREESLSEKVYDHLARASGYASLDDAERTLKGEA